MNITKPAWRRPVAMACVGALAALGWTTVGDAAHAATDLPAAQFASVSGSGACAANEQAPATYTGTFAAKLQMTELLKPYETQVKSEADAGHFPWDKETVSTSASFYYTVTFPQGTTVQAASASVSSSMIASVTEYYVSSDSLTHKFKIKLNDVNWAEIYAAYQQDASNPSAHTVDVTIPYSVAANSADEAKTIAARNVTATGSFSFYPSRRGGLWGLVGLQTFNMDAFSAPVASDMSAFPCLTPAAPVGPTIVSQAGTLPADLLGAVDSGAVDTEHDAVAVAAGQSSPVSLTGALYTDSIKKQMADIETQYSQTNSDFSKIAVSNVDFGFEAVLTLPEGMAYTDASKSATLSGSDDFKVSSVVVSGQTATVKVGLTDAAKAKVRTYADLKAIVDAVASPLQVTVAGVVFTSASSADTEYTVTGSVSGSFAALASKSAATGDREIQFNLTWTGEQKTGLEDAKTQSGITYTVKYKAAPVEPTTPTEPTKNTTKTPSTSRTLAKTGFSGALVGGLGMLFAAAGAVAVRQKRD